MTQFDQFSRRYRHIGCDVAQHAHGTGFAMTRPWATYRACLALCPDGIVRSVRISQCADTFFSIPATVQISRGGKRYSVAGYVTMQDTAPQDSCRDGVVVFRAVDTCKHADTVFPKRPFVAIADVEFAARYQSPAKSSLVRF